MGNEEMGSRDLHKRNDPVKNRIVSLISIRDSIERLEEEHGHLLNSRKNRADLNRIQRECDNIIRCVESYYESS